MLFKTIFVASVFFQNFPPIVEKQRGHVSRLQKRIVSTNFCLQKEKHFQTSFISEDLSKVHWFFLFGYGTLKKMFNKKHNSHLKHFTKLEISVELFLGFYYRLQLNAKGSVIHSKFPISILRLDRLVGRYNVLSLEQKFNSQTERSAF